MRKIIVAAAFVAAVALLASGCGKKAAAPPADELNSEIAAVAGELNAYLSEHNFANTDAGALAGELNKLAAKYGELEKRAHDMRTQEGGEQYGDVGNLAGEGRAKAEALASTIAAGAPMGDAAKATALNDVVENWADYSDRVGAPPEGEEPGVGEPAAPGEEPGVGEPAEPGAPSYPGKGHHYGWWKNPEWARDPASRGAEGDAPGTGEMEREREREREREHVQPGTGKGGGEGPKGSGGDAGKGSGGGKGRGGK